MHANALVGALPEGMGSMLTGLSILTLHQNDLSGVVPRMQFAPSCQDLPDFVSASFVIECKGRANESFPLRWKMFKKYVNHKMKHVTLYKPQNQKECDKVIELIIKNRIK